jgi:hypothetical protein
MVSVARTRKQSKGLAFVQETGILQFSFGEWKIFKESMWNQCGTDKEKDGLTRRIHVRLDQGDETREWMRRKREEPPLIFGTHAAESVIFPMMKWKHVPASPPSTADCVSVLQIPLKRDASTHNPHYVLFLSYILSRSLRL